MATKKDTLQRIDELNNMMLLVQTYEEIAASRIKKIRSSVLQTRSFTAELSNIFHELKTSYEKELARLMNTREHKGMKDFTAIKHNGKNLCLFLSANTGLFGDIVTRTFSLFETEIAKGQTDIAVVGKLGSGMFKTRHPDTEFTYFDYPDNGENTELLGKLITFIVPYDNLYVFYGQFQSIVMQQPVIANVYGIENQEEKASDKPQIKYFFEPSLETIMQFFETEIFASIFEQTIHESQLSKNASRMLTLDSATQNIKTTLKREEFLMRVLNHRMTNRKQLSSLSGMSLWGK